MSIKKTPREIKSEQNYSNIVINARKLFLEYGFERVTVDDICAHASVSKSTFYTHFCSKQDLLMIHAGLDRDCFLQEQYSYDENIPFKELFLKFFHANFAYNHQSSLSFNRETYISYIKVYRQEPLYGRFYNDSLRQLIERGMHEKAFRQELTAQEYYHMLHDWIIGFFIGWSIHQERTPIIDQMYVNVLNAMVDALLK